MYEWHPINTILSVGFDLNSKLIDQIKTNFQKKWPNSFDLPPHIGLILLPISQSSYQPAFNEAIEFVNQWKTAKQLKIRQIIIEPTRDGAHFIKIALDLEWLIHQHNLLMDLLLKYRSQGLIRQKDFQRLTQNKFSPVEIERLYQNGFIYSRDKYNPHITLGRISHTDWQDSLTQAIQNDTKELLNESIILDQVHIIYHTDAPVQTQMQIIKRLDILLE